MEPHFRNRIIETGEDLRQQYNGQRTGSVLADDGEGKPAEHLAEFGRSADRLDEIAGMLRDKR